jgi:hypothetical protein
MKKTKKRNLKQGTITKRTVAVRKYLVHGDMRKLAKLTGYSEVYVMACMSGRRQNRAILETAVRIAKQNREMGIVNNE